MWAHVLKHSEENPSSPDGRCNAFVGVSAIAVGLSSITPEQQPAVLRYLLSTKCKVFVLSGLRPAELVKAKTLAHECGTDRMVTCLSLRPAPSHTC